MKSRVFIGLYLLIINAYGQIEVFSPSASNTIESSKNREFEWSLGVNPCIMAKGMFGLNTELGLSSKFTAQIGAGITTYDYIYEAVGPELTETSISDYGTHYSPLAEEFHESNTGWFGDFNLRFYPAEHDEFDGFYISPGIRLRSYNCTGTVLDEYATPPTSKIYDMSYSMTEPNLKVGWQTANIFNDEILVDYYMGVARSQLSRKGYKEIENLLGDYDTEAVTGQKIRVIPMIGFNISYKF